MKTLRILILVLIISLVSACSLSPGIPAPTPTNQSPLPRSMKGYELYSWYAQEQWHFALLTGTNRNKTVEEILSSANTVTPDGWVSIQVLGLEAAKNLLARLPQGAEIFLAANFAQAGYPDRLPRESIEALKAFCISRGLVIYAGE